MNTICSVELSPNARVLSIRLTTCALVASMLTVRALAQVSDEVTDLESASASLTLDPSSSAWRFKVAPYSWLTAQSGDLAVKGLPVDLDVSHDDAFVLLSDYFNLAVWLRAEATRGRWTLFGDLMYLNFTVDDVPAPPIGRFTVRQEQAVLELGAGYAIWDTRGQDGSGIRFECLAGTRMHYFSMEIEPTFFPTVAQDQAWVDAFVGARATCDLTDRIGVYARGDVGAGGSDLTWNVEGAVDLRLSSRASVSVGYRALSVDYLDGSGRDRFEYDVVLHGPFIALSFSF